MSSPGDPHPGPAGSRTERRELLARLLRERAAQGQAGAHTDLFAADLDAAGAQASPPPLAPPEQPPRTVLLTGATGFLGRHILAELLARASLQVICLVRAPNATAGAERISSALADAGLPQAELAPRVTVLPGSLAAPQLGQSDEAYEQLAWAADAIIHCGATVHYGYPYQSLREANVVGTRRIAELAREGRPSAFHLVSSFGIFEGALLAGAAIDESSAPRQTHLPSLGYTQSKLVAELLARQLLGPALSIYRPPFIGGDSRGGAFNPSDFLWLLIRGCAMIGAAPRFDAALVDLCPVDVVARSLVSLAMGPAPGGRTFHLFSPHQPLSWRELWEQAGSAGGAVRLLPLRQWYDELRNQARSRDELLLLAVLVQAMWPLFDRLAQGPVGRIAASRTVSELEALGITCPAPRALFQHYFRHLPVKQGSPRDSSPP
jgi:thioester reductase-like protein